MASDKQRLDWLQKYGALELYGGLWGAWSEVNANGGTYYNQNIRQAIDAAIKAAKKRGGDHGE